VLMERMEPADNDCDEHVGHKCKRRRRLQSDKDSYDSVKPPLQLSLAWLRQVPASLFKQTESIHNRFRIHGAVFQRISQATPRNQERTQFASAPPSGHSPWHTVEKLLPRAARAQRPSR
jgi:hypothetical protein